MANPPVKINDDSDADKYYIIEDNKIYHRSKKDNNYNLDLTGYKPVRSAFKNYLKEDNISDITKPSINNISESTDAVESNNIVEPTNTPETNNNVESVANVIPKTSNSTDIRNMFNIEQKVHHNGSFGVPAKDVITNDNKSNITEPLIVQGITSSSHTPKSRPITKQSDNDRLIEILKNNMDEDDKPDEPLNIL